MSRPRVLWHYVAARRRRFADRADLERRQADRLRRVLAAAPRRYPFYAGLLGVAPPVAPRALTELPILGKAEVIEHFAALNTRGVTLAECLAAGRSAEAGRDFGTRLRGLSVGLSSGTSGRQTAFLTSGAERDRWAGEVLARALPDGLRAGARVTLVLRAGGPLYESVDGGRVSFRFVDLAAEPDRIVADIRRSEPTILVAPPSVLVLVAAAGGVRPQRVFSVAEVLEPQDERAIEAGLGVRVDQVYQAAEGLLGMSCAVGRLHLAEDLVVIEREAVATDRFTPVVTDLFRVSQAVLRRRVDDVLVAGPGECSCGSPTAVVERILGRADDVLWLARDAGSGAGFGLPEGADSGAGPIAPFFPDFVRAAVLAAAEIDDFRVVQTGADRIRLATRPAAGYEAARAGLLAAFTRAGFASVRIEPGEFEPHDPLRKLRRVRREVDVDSGNVRPVAEIEPGRSR